MMRKKRVRMLLRVSSNQQLEADGDLSVQRQLVKEYVVNHEDWVLDKKEYFEGSNSGYKNAVSERDVLQEALADAQRQEYDILVAYKDDRFGRRMWEMGGYIMALKSYGVDTYTVKDGCISPEMDDIMGQMILALRYGNAQKSSSDTGMRVKDTALKLVEKGKFMGGNPPYGYELVMSGELSKHGRVLHTLQIIPEQAEVVQYIYHLSLYKEYGSGKIANALNNDEYYRKMAPRDIWKSGTITSILSNPVYTGCVAYKRRERINGKYHRMDQADWIKSARPDETIRVIEDEIWNKVQEKRKIRAEKYAKKQETKESYIIGRSNGMLPLIGVIYCGYCGGKMINGSKYNYWTIKKTGEKRSSRIPIYRCQNAKQGMPHSGSSQFHAVKLEKIIFDFIGLYINGLQKQEDILSEILKNQQKETERRKTDLRKEQQRLEKIQKEIEILERSIPEAMEGNYALTLEELAGILRRHQQIEEKQKEKIEAINIRLNEEEFLNKERKENYPDWQQILREADIGTKRALVNKMIERIEITREEIVICFMITKEEYLSRITDGSDTTPYTPGSE